jgi:hypothetical protein
MGRRKVRTGTPMLKCLACGMIEDGGRILFLKRKDRNGIERIELPCALVVSGRSPVAEIKAEFNRQTGIDAQIHEIIIESRHNAGSRRRRNWIPCLVFKFSAKNMRAKPASEFSGFKWMKLDEAKKEKLGRNVEWIRKIT